MLNKFILFVISTYIDFYICINKIILLLHLVESIDLHIKIMSSSVSKFYTIFMLLSLALLIIFTCGTNLLNNLYLISCASLILILIYLLNFLYIIIILFLYVEVKAKICDSPSRTWSGPCIRDSVCNTTCIDAEYSNYGACGGYGFDCICFFKC